VQFALKAGRIERNPDGTIESDRADLDWEKNTNHNKARYKKPPPAPGSQPMQPSQHRRDPAVDAAAGLKQAQTWSQRHMQATSPNAPDGLTLNTAKAVHELYAARLKKIEFDEKQGSVISKAHVEIAHYNFYHVLRDSLLNIPSRISAQVAAETDPAIVYDLIYAELFGILNESEKGPKL
jgi:hypothetical protein